MFENAFDDVIRSLEKEDEKIVCLEAMVNELCEKVYELESIIKDDKKVTWL